MNKLYRVLLFIGFTLFFCVSYYFICGLNKRIDWNRLEYDWYWLSVILLFSISQSLITLHILYHKPTTKHIILYYLNIFFTFFGISALFLKMPVGIAILVYFSCLFASLCLGCYSLFSKNKSKFYIYGSILLSTTLFMVLSIFITVTIMYSKGMQGF